MLRLTLYLVQSVVLAYPEYRQRSDPGISLLEMDCLFLQFVKSHLTGIPLRSNKQGQMARMECQIQNVDEDAGRAIVAHILLEEVVAWLEMLLRVSPKGHHLSG